MVRSYCVNVYNSWLHDLKDQNITTKKDMLGLALEKKDKTTRGVAASDGLGFSGDTQNHHICQQISVYVHLPSTFS